MSKFQCFIDRFLEGSQFCETQSERCRDCKDYAEYCFKDNFHISNCSRFCYDIMVKNITLGMKYRTIPDRFYLPENYHFLIESLMGFVIIVLITMTINQSSRFLAGIARRVFIVNQADEATAEKNEIQTLITQYPTEEGHEMPEVKVNIMENQQMSSTNNCGFTQHNQISNATKDDPLLCLSGRRETWTQ